MLNKIFNIIIILFLLMISGLLIAQDWKSTNPITIAGNNSNWTMIGLSRSGNKVIRVKANLEEKVDFGCNFGGCVDTITAGVNGNDAWRIIQIFQDAWDSQDIGTLKNILKGTQAVNFNQGGAWVKVVAFGDESKNIFAPNLFYYWQNGFNEKGIAISQPFKVFAKAHDGGKDSESTDSYGDNRGSYTMWLEYKNLEDEINMDD